MCTFTHTLTLTLWIDAQNIPLEGRGEDDAKTDTERTWQRTQTLASTAARDHKKGGDLWGGVGVEKGRRKNSDCEDDVAEREAHLSSHQLGGWYGCSFFRSTAAMFAAVLVSLSNSALVIS